MTLIKTSFLNAFAVAARMAALLGVNKILAVYGGPAGYALFGQFQNFVQIVGGISSGAIANGVTKYTAEHRDEPELQVAVWRAATGITVVGSLIAGALVALASGPLAARILGDPGLSGVFLWFAAGLLLMAINSMLLAILNGRREIGRYVAANLGGSALIVALTFYLAWVYGIYGAMVALALHQSAASVITLALCRGREWADLKNFLGRVDRRVAKGLGKFLVMALASAICLPSSQLIVRDVLVDRFGWESAGLWEAVNRLSSAYLMFITATLTVYLLPKLSELTCPRALRSEMRHSYSIVLPAVALMSACVYLLRDPIIALLFTSEFALAGELLPLQLVGDVLRVGAWMMAYVLLSKAMMGPFVAAEVGAMVVYVALAKALSAAFGMQGAIAAYAVTYALYWVLLACFVRHMLGSLQSGVLVSRISTNQ